MIVLYEKRRAIRIGVTFDQYDAFRYRFIMKDLPDGDSISWWIVPGTIDLEE